MNAQVIPNPSDPPRDVAFPPASGTRLDTAVKAFLGILLVLWIPVHLSLPIGRDQAIIARVAQTMLDGGWPYVDAWDHKGPAAFLLYAPALALLGQAEDALYRAELLLLAGMFFVYRFLALRFEIPLAAPLALLTLVLCVRNGHWSFAQPDTWVGYLVVAVGALLLHPRFGMRPASLLAAGFALGFATMVKPVFAAFLVMPAAALLTAPAEQRRLAGAIVVTLGFAAAIVAVSAPFVLAGHGGALWETYIVFNVGGHMTRTWQDAEVWLIRFLGTLVLPRMHIGMLAILIAAGFGFHALLRRDRRAALVLGAGWLAALLAVAVQGKSFPYHYMAVHGFTAIFAASFVAVRLEEMTRTLRQYRDRPALRRNAVITGLLLGGVYAAILPHATRTAEWWATQAGAMSREAFEARACETDYCLPMLRELGAEIRKLSAPGEPIFVWGFDSAVYLFAQRPATSRFGFSYPLIGGTPTWRAEARAELMATLDATRPPVIVVQTNDPIRLMASRPSSDHLAEFPELASLIATRYALSVDLEDFLVYRRRD
jgi:hypothetical protein